MDFILTVAFIILLLMHLSLRDRVNQLAELLNERRVKQKPETTHHTAAAIATPIAPQHAIEETSAVGTDAVPVASAPTPITTRPVTRTPQPAEPNPIVEWFKENTLIKVGAIIFFLGIVWFVSYAIAQGWISPTIRIWLGIGIGVLLATVGHIRRKVNLDHYLTLTTLGVSTIIAAIYAGQQFFQLFHPVIALGLLILPIAYAVLVSVQTDRGWLCYLAAIAGLLAPSMINAPTTAAIPFFTYLTFMSAGFLAVLWFKPWRLLILILTLGSVYFEIAYASHHLATDTVLWFAVIAQSALLYGSLALSSREATKPMWFDLTTVGILGVTYTSFAHTLTTSDALLTFSAGFVVATIGYSLYHQRAAALVIGLHSALALFLIMVASSFAFDGFSLTLAFALEVGLVVSLAAYIGLKPQWFLSSCLLFFIPLVSAGWALTDSAWQYGFLHSAGYSLYTLVLVSAGLAWWLLYHARHTNRDDFRTAGGAFMATVYLTSTITTLYLGRGIVGWLVATGYQPSVATTAVLSYLMMYAISLLLLHVILRYRLPEHWLYSTGATLWLPALLALGTIDGPWPSQWLHLRNAGLALLIVTSLVLGFTFLNQHLRSPRQVTQLLAISSLCMGWILFCATSWKHWHSVITLSELSLVLSYISWLVLSYLMLQLALGRVAPREWITGISLSFALPILASTSSLAETAWAGNWLHPHATGLYVLTTIMLVVGLGLHRYARTYPEADRSNIQDLGTAFLIIMGLYASRLVWLITHAVLPEDDYAVTIALLIYTITGLCFYLIGKRHNRSDFKYTSAILLSGVVLRLAVVDVWNMEILWRIVTFLGIGVLFILTALVEKPFQQRPHTPAVAPTEKL